MSFLNFLLKFLLVSKCFSCNTRSYVILIAFSKFSFIFLSLVVAWMLSLIYTGAGGSLLGEWWKFVEMSRIVFLFLALWKIYWDDFFVDCVWDAAPWIFWPYKIMKINWYTTGSMFWQHSLKLTLDVIPFFVTFASRRAPFWKFRSFSVSFNSFWIPCRKTL